MGTESLCTGMSTKTNSSNERTTSSPTRVRCINLDWLEVHALEPIDQPHDASYYAHRGFVVHERGYGTRVYREMFTLDGTDGLPLIEIRRNPASQGVHGIHAANETHIRLVNRACYFDNAAQALAQFLVEHHYTDIRISRVDVCMDFVKFDRNDDPGSFVRRYFQRVYSKINQTSITGHGSDTWHGQDWNSLSWGSISSDVGTKMYDKTMELYDPISDSYAKPYIRDAWLRCHMIDDVHRCTMRGEKVRVWRVEFSVRSSVRKWFVIELNGAQRKRTGKGGGKPKGLQSVANTLDCWDGRDKLLVMFASLANHYFHFKYFEPDKRKDRCRDKVLFDFSGVQTTYKIGRDQKPLGAGTHLYKPMDSLLRKIRMYKETKSDEEIRVACDTLIKSLTDDCDRSDLANPWSHEELQALREIMRIRCRHPELHVSVVMKEVKELLSMPDNAAVF